MTTKDHDGNGAGQRSLAIHRLETRATCRGTGVQHDRTDLCGVANKGPHPYARIGAALSLPFDHAVASKVGRRSSIEPASPG